MNAIKQSCTRYRPISSLETAIFAAILFNQFLTNTYSALISITRGEVPKTEGVSPHPLHIASLTSPNPEHGLLPAFISLSQQKNPKPRDFGFFKLHFGTSSQLNG